MILLGIFIWSIVANHPWVSFFLFLRFFTRMILALVAAPLYTR